MFKFFTKLDYLLKETFLGLLRGGWMNWAAVSTVTVLLFLFGLSLQTSWQVERLLNQFGSQLELSVYLESGIQAVNIEPLIAQMPEVATVQVITKEQAWTKLVKDLGIADIDGATQQLGDNPLVDEMKVKALNPQVVPSLATQLAKFQGVDVVQYVDEAVKRIAQLHRGLNWITLTITIILTSTAIAVTTTTIGLIVMARRREIEIMQLVGATSAWIYLPFILQGISFGLVGGAIAWSFISLTQQFINRLLANQPEFIQFISNGLQLTVSQTLLLPLILLGFGAAVGLIGSLFAVRRFAKS
ncbi:ABC transporter permease [Anabaena cylindrica FACHB-243]|uniref:Cell division protein FtsX n=1 Tax=Anabaena cylindrica (strain ATCC 27899 / PCC 7122) TaxID=272123 RepID=K9ZFA1_ANACC|nr:MULTISPECIES: ABC transporter permease [Anabaena]AFZ57040.1 cell division protein FtsX [Anabaena cylindrica PCC 7122]MBD2421489.1 ABC transporter permease [Anabaena cylindrica FACHB-243]MBY5284680.1 ABC transporter permease [Anabaena sp. CCAP 1446/1C]MBY5311421.1 ABC transporter permease [Anabaena sp. CCAP 1446/1C]MCM2407750.1 ABC transporter permease [Anabaena sp. CCAP 1446/1C]